MGERPSSGDGSDPADPELGAQVALLMAERGVLGTLYRYGHSIDYGHEEEWLDCFASDGIFDVRYRVGAKPSRRFEGHDDLAGFIAAHSRAPHRWHKHLLFEPLVTIDGDRATARSYFARLDAADDGTPFVRAFGRYVDELARGADGKWRFVERIAEVEAVVMDPDDRD
jgi:hypothetical protein